MTTALASVSCVLGMRSLLCRRALVFSVLALPAAAQSIKLNGPLARGVSGEIGFPPETSIDKRYHVYTADRDGDHVFELYSVLAQGKEAPVFLAGPVPEYASARITVDGSGVLFLSDFDGDWAHALTVVPIDGSAPPLLLSGHVVAPAYVSWFQQTPDGSRVLYLSNQESSGPFELFSVPIGGGASVKLSGTPVPGGQVQGVSISGDGHFAVYSADQETDERRELFVVPVEGSAPARKLPIPKLSHRLVPGGSVRSFQISADSRTVVFDATRGSWNELALLAAPIGGQEKASELSGPFQGPGSVHGYQLGANGSVVYRADQDTPDAIELYAARRCLRSVPSPR